MPPFYFYPRSPCGERQQPHPKTSKRPHNFYPRSPCGERHWSVNIKRPAAKFLSTLSLRRATLVIRWLIHRKLFLSTLSLRRATLFLICRHLFNSISIHALLAESDVNDDGTIQAASVFLSTLSLRRATWWG